jgi:hypothetical protein
MTAAAPRRKMTLTEQAAWLQYLRDRTKLSRGGGDPKHCWMQLTRDEMADLDTIVETLHLLAVHGADRFVRDEIAKIGKRRAR